MSSEWAALLAAVEPTLSPSALPTPEAQIHWDPATGALVRVPAGSRRPS